MEEQKLIEKEKESAENKMVDDAFQHLLNTYLASNHRKKVEIITKAFHFAEQAHKGVRRLSGEPYIMHPIAVAQIACEEMGLGSTSICSALIHDVVEDTDYTVEDIRNIFGDKIAKIVDGLTKISGGIFGDKASAQAENFKKLLLTMSDDIRVILIKICDRLHNMRTLASQSKNKQYKIAGETLYIYAPLANRLGLNKIKTELEDLSFKFEHPEEYADITNKLSFTKEQREKLFNDFTTPIRESLDAMGFKYKLIARVKSPYSIWNKMQTKHVTFDEIYDILAARIIFVPNDREQEINECFQIYVAISKIYKSHPNRLRDWVNHPKANGYQALHVTLMSKQGRWIEVQIRSDRMNEIAERGFAAHWKYKSKGEFEEDEGEFGQWLNTIKEILNDPQPDAMDFLDVIKLNLFASEIFVFTPKGEIKTMPAGSTALDFAFNIHTFLGSHCIGAKVNHKLVPISHVLQSGDQVEILTSKSQHAQPEWLDFATTAKAKAKIKAVLRRNEREIQMKGKEVLNEWLEKNDLEMSISILDKLCKFHNFQKHESLFFQLGNGSLQLTDKDINAITDKNQHGYLPTKWISHIPFLGKNKQEKTKETTPQLSYTIGPDFDKKHPIMLTEENIDTFLFSNCCHPIPGDDVLGFIDNHDKVVIHKVECPVASRLKTGYGNRILDVKWDMHDNRYFNTTIEIRGLDRQGMLLEVSTVITNEMNVNIQSMNITSQQGIFDGSIVIGVHNRNEIKKVIENLKKIAGIQQVERIM